MPEANLSVVGNLDKAANSYVQVQHSTRGEDSPYSSPVIKAHWCTMAAFT